MMAGLRDRKKQTSRRRIIEAAVKLFGDAGLEATTMDDIAAVAEVSVATVYNYFGSKHALLLAAVDEDTSRMVERGAAVLSRPGEHPAEAVQRLLGVYLSEFTAWDPALLREVMSASFQRVGGAELTAELARMDERLIEQIVELLEGLHSRGDMRTEVDPYEAALLLFSAMVTQLLIYLAVEDFDASMLVVQVNRQVDIAFGGLSPSENEKATQP